MKMLHSLARMIAEHQCFSLFYISEKLVKISNNNIKKTPNYGTLMLSMSNIVNASFVLVSNNLLVHSFKV